MGLDEFWGMEYHTEKRFFPKNDIFCREKADFSLNMNLTKS